MRAIFTAISITLLSSMSFACYGNLADTFSNELSNSYNVHKESSNLLMDNATKRFETLKNCRGELLEAWTAFQAEKMKVVEMQNTLAIEIRAQELKYRKEILSAKKQCRAQSVEQFTTIKEAAYGSGVINDPTQAVGFQQKLNGWKTKIYNDCTKHPDNVEMMALAREDLNNNIARLNAKMKTAQDSLNNFSEQTQKIQEQSVKECEERKELLAYNEAVTANLTAQGAHMAKEQSTLGRVGAVLGCMGFQGNRGLANDDATESDTKF